MSNNSWKQYGGIAKMEEYNVINANTIVAEQFVSRSTKPIYQFLNGTFEVANDLSAANNIITSNSFFCFADTTVNNNIYANQKLFFGSGTFNAISPNLSADSTHAYMYGDASFIGVNIQNPNTIFHITSNVPDETNILLVESSNNYIRNILAQNKNDRGVVLDADDTSANLYFHLDSSTNRFNVSDANITYTLGGNLSTSVSNEFVVHSKFNNIFALENIHFDSSGGYALDTSGTTTLIDRSNANTSIDISGSYHIHSHDNYNITTNGNMNVQALNGNINIDTNKTNYNSFVNISHVTRGLSGEFYDQLLTVYDVSNVPFLPNMYDISGTLTGNSIVAIAKDASSNTFIRMAAGNSLLGAAYGGGAFPNDTSRSMNMIGVNDASGEYLHNQIIVSNNNKEKYISTLGINTFHPQSDKYTVDINGPVRIANGEIQTMTQANFEFKSVKFSTSNPLYGIAIGTPSTLTDDPTNPIYNQFGLYTMDGGINWNLSNNIYGTSDFNQTRVNFLDTYVYDSNYAFIVGEKSYIYYTNDSGLNWYRSTYGDLLFRDQVNIIGAVNGTDLRMYVPYKYNNDATSQIDSYTKQIRYFDIPIAELSTTLNGNLYSISSSEVSLNIDVECSTVNSSHVFFAGNGIVIFNIDLTGNPIYHLQSYTFHDIMAVTDDLIIAVGNNVISYSQDAGVNWSIVNIANDTVMISNKNNITNIVLKSIFALNEQNIVVVGDEGIFGFSQNGPASSNWQIVPDSILNSSGISERINGINNSLIDIYMTNDDSMIISNVITNSFNDEVNNENDIPGFSKVLHVFIPALFNRPSNKILDISGNISITGDIDIFDGDMSIKNRLFVNYIDGNPDGIFPDTKNLTIGENTQIINIGNVEPSSRTEGIYAEEASYNFINIGAVQPSTTTKPYYIQMGNFSGSVPDVSQNKIVIGGATDDIVFGGGGITIKSEAEFLVTNRIVRVNNEAPDANLSAGSGLYVYENYGLGDTDQNAGFVAISDDRRGFNFKPTIKNSHIVTLETEDMSLNFNNPYNTEYGINDIQNGLLVLTKTYNNTGGDYSITVKPIDISNILIRDSALSNEERQFILTKLSVQDDVSFNTNLYVKDKIGIDTHNAIISLDISANDAIRIPVGTNAERELFNHQTGQIRFNTSTSQFEGYNNSGAWQGLGGVIDVDQNTFILAESGPTKDENQLRFFTADYNSDSSLMKPRLQMILDASNGGLAIGHNISSDISNVLYHPPSDGLTVQGDVSLNENLFVSGDISVNQNVYIGKDLIVDGNITVEQYRNETIINTTTTNYFLTVAEDMSLNGRLFVRDDVSFNSNLYLKDKLGIDTHSAVVSLDISTNDALKLPIGSDAERPTLTSDYYHGFIRFNKNILYDGTGDYTYEGSYGLNEWKPLGQHWKGVIDTDGDTFITAENSYGEDGDDLKFYTKDNLRITIDQSGNFGFGAGTIDDISFNIHGFTHIDGSLNITGFLTQDSVAVLNGSGSNISANVQIIGNHSGNDGMYIGYNQTSTLADLRFYTNDNIPKMVIKTNGDISMNHNLVIAGDVSLNGDLHVGQVAYTTRLEHPLSTASNKRTIDLGNSLINYNNITGVPESDRNIESVPQGGIILWLRPNNIPTGFRICDGGENDDGTTETVDILGANVNIPDLRSKFVIGYHENDPSFGQVGNTGGSFNITSEQLPEHSHYSVENHSYGGTDYYLGQYNSVSTHASGGNYIGVSIDDNDETKRYTTSSTLTGGSGQNYAPPYYVAVYIIRVSTALSADQQLLGQTSFYVPHKLGIGTTEPATNLHIDYTVDVSANGWYTDASMAQILISDGGDIVYNSGRFAIGFVDDYAFLQAAYHNSTTTTTTTAKNISMQPKGGNVGIGTTNPLATLDVGGAFRNDGETNNIGIIVAAGSRSDSVSHDFTSSTAILRIIGNNATNNLQFGVGDSGYDYSPWIQASYDNSSSNNDDSGSKSILLNPLGGNVGIGTTSPGQRLDVNGTVQATSFNATSDIRLKDNIVPLNNSLLKIIQLQGVNFTWKKEDTNIINAGLIAQDIEKVIPEVVTTQNNEMQQKSVNYNGLIPYLIESVKTLSNDKEIMQQEINNLKNENEAMKEKMKQYDAWFAQLLNK